MQEQLSRAFAAAFGAKDQAQLQIAGLSLVYHLGQAVRRVGDKAVLISPATAAGRVPRLRRHGRRPLI